MLQVIISFVPPVSTHDIGNIPFPIVFLRYFHGRKSFLVGHYREIVVVG